MSAEILLVYESLNTLAAITVVPDFLECLDALEMFSIRGLGLMQN